MFVFKQVSSNSFKNKITYKLITNDICKIIRLCANKLLMLNQVISFCIAINESIYLCLYKGLIINKIIRVRNTSNN